MKEIQGWLGLLLVVLLCRPVVAGQGDLDPWQMETERMLRPAHGFGSAAIGESIYVVGGQAPGPYGNDIVQRYDPANDIWVQVAPLPTARHSLGSAAVDGYLYAIAGHVYNSRSENERYDPGTNTWQSMAPKPTAVSGPGVAAVGGKIYTFGGNRYATMQSVIEVYDPATNSWANVGNMPLPGEPWQAAALGGKIYLAGGYFAADGGTTDHLWGYDPATGTWDTSLPRMNHARHAHELVVLDDCLYALGGTVATGSATSVERWMPGAANWVEVESLNVPRSELGAEVIDGRIYAFGGNNSTAGNLDLVESTVPEPVTLALFCVVAAPALLKRGRKRRGKR